MHERRSRTIRRSRRLLKGGLDAGRKLIRRLPFGGRNAPAPAPAPVSAAARQPWTGSADVLDRYLVAGYQNPRLNVQAILVRHVLLADVLGDRAAAGMEDEIRYAIDLNETLRRRAEELGVTMGVFRDPEKLAAVERVSEAVADKDHVFLDRWREELRAAPPSRIPVLEFACGSADDYRGFAECGLGPCLSYVGIDINADNVANARRRHPEARFEVDDILALRFEDRSFDHVIAADIFEHLPPDAFRRAIDEAGRLARRALVFTFFNMADVPEHEIRPMRSYHRNLLSRRRIEEQVRGLGFETVLCLPIAPWLERQYGYAHSYNPYAWTIVAEREAELVPRLPHRWGEDAGAST
jgi:ubiquinone/menaquinone biosynthesis C-methylase UbiE